MNGTFYYDLHIHSCLSPCADMDMTPANIVGMAKLKGLDVIALTDHNACRNCGAAVAMGKNLGVLVLPGMELCTAEDVHVVCLFAELAAAEAFSSVIYPLLPDVPNRPDIFGEQQIMDENDCPAGMEPRFLLSGANIRVDKVRALTDRYGGAAYPAHVDRPSNGILGILGGIPPEAGFAAAELSAACDETAFLQENPCLHGLKILHSSDAHRLWQISERQNSLTLPELSAAAIIAHIKQQKST